MTDKTDITEATTGHLYIELLKRLADGSTHGPISLAAFELLRASERAWSGLPDCAAKRAAEGVKVLKARKPRVDPNTPEYVALKEAFGRSYERGPRLGCCRVYLCFDEANAKAVKAAAKRLGRIFQTKSHYGDRNALYIGYDNADGIAVGQARGMIAVLASMGLRATESLCGD